MIFTMWIYKNNAYKCMLHFYNTIFFKLNFVKLF